MAKLTETTLLKITVPPGKRDVLVFDDSLPGFGVRKFDSGRASFFAKYSIGRQQRKVTLGAVVPGMLAKARKRAAEVLAKAKLGEDVQAAKKAARTRKVATLGELVPRYLAEIAADRRPATIREYRAYLQRHWQPLHARPIEDVTRGEVVTIIDRVAEEAGRVSADRAKSALGAFFSWAIDRGYRDSSPVSDIRKRANGGGRERVLSEAEIRRVWLALGDDDHSQIVRLLLLTAQRKSEIGDLRWSEIDFERRQITLPGSRTKNGLGHTIALSEPALAILKARPRYLDRDFVFGEGLTRGYQGWSKSKAQLDQRLGEMSPWTLHDLRRTAVTHLNDRGIAPPHVVEAIVNHISGHRSGVAGIYNRSQHTEEKRKALAVWAAYLVEVVAQ